MSIQIRHPQPKDETAFIEAVARSRDLLHPWIAAPKTHDAFAEYLDKYSGDRDVSFLAVDSDGQIIGCININEIIRGKFRSAFLGYYGFVPFVGKGLMKQAMALVITEAFDKHDLHRLEANIQTGNAASLGLVRSLGFRHEGFSPRYLFIDGQWRGHERYAITAEDWAVHESRSDT